MSPFKSSAGRALGKLLEGYKSSDIGKGFGAGDTLEATGGAVMTIGDYTYHIFIASGSFETFTPTFNKTINYVVVGGGGGAGSGATGNGSNHYGGGGGGAGGVRVGTALISGLNVYNVTIGDGGAGNNTPFAGPTPGFGSRGIDSTFGLSSPVVGSGGGGGENRNSRVNGGKSNANADSYMPGGSGGGTGGGAGAPVGSVIASPDGISPTTQGYNGGSGDPSGQAGGGGGGASGTGSSAPNDANAGPGGNGTTTVFPGPAIQPALPAAYKQTLGTSWRDALGPTGLVGGGGGGGQGSSNFVSNGTGGPGGGGPGCPNNDGPGVDGINGTGGGGGGGAAQNSTGGNAKKGGNGGKGIVMIRYPK